MLTIVCAYVKIKYIFISTCRKNIKSWIFSLILRNYYYIDKHNHLGSEMLKSLVYFMMKFWYKSTFRNIVQYATIFSITILMYECLKAYVFISFEWELPNSRSLSSPIILPMKTFKPSFSTLVWPSFYF